MELDMQFGKWVADLEAEAVVVELEGLVVVVLVGDEGACLVLPPPVCSPLFP